MPVLDDDDGRVQPPWRPRPWAAALLALLSTVLAYLYVGVPRRALGLAAVAIAALLLATAAVLAFPAPLTVWSLVLVIVAIRLGVPIDAWRLARGRPFAPRRAFQRLVVLAPLAVAWAFIAQPRLLATVRAHVTEAFRIPSAAMEPTILAGDYLLTAPLRRRVARDALVVHDHEGVKRIQRAVGIPGDTLAMRNGTLLRNGAAVAEPYVRLAASDATADEFAWQRAFRVPDANGGHEAPTAQTWGPIVVPPAHYFMLGDNRGESLDSRYVGFAPESTLVARAHVVYFSRDTLGAIRWGRIGRALR